MIILATLSNSGWHSAPAIKLDENPPIDGVEMALL